MHKLFRKMYKCMEGRPHIWSFTCSN